MGQRFRSGFKRINFRTIFKFLHFTEYKLFETALMLWKQKVYLSFLHLVLERTLFVEYILYNIIKKQPFL